MLAEVLVTVVNGTPTSYIAIAADERAINCSVLDVEDLSLEKVRSVIQKVPEFQLVMSFGLDR
jgi:hypothetical protein